MHSQSASLPFPELDLHLVRRPEQAEAGGLVLLRDRHVSSLKVPHQQPTALSVDFDTLQARLAELPRMFLELDGSFMWAGDDRAINWRIDGMIYENALSVQWVEVKGHCPLSAWDELLEQLGHGTEPLMALWLPEQCFLDIDQVRGYWSDGVSKS